MCVCGETRSFFLYFFIDLVFCQVDHQVFTESWVNYDPLAKAGFVLSWVWWIFSQSFLFSYGPWDWTKFSWIGWSTLYLHFYHELLHLPFRSSFLLPGQHHTRPSCIMFLLMIYLSGALFTFRTYYVHNKWRTEWISDCYCWLLISSLSLMLASKFTWQFPFIKELASYPWLSVD